MRIQKILDVLSHIDNNVWNVFKFVYSWENYEIYICNLYALNHFPIKGLTGEIPLIYWDMLNNSIV